MEIPKDTTDLVAYFKILDKTLMEFQDARLDLSILQDNNVKAPDKAIQTASENLFKKIDELYALYNPIKFGILDQILQNIPKWARTHTYKDINDKEIKKK